MRKEWHQWHWEFWLRKDEGCARWVLERGSGMHGYFTLFQYDLSPFIRGFTLLNIEYSPGHSSRALVDMSAGHLISLFWIITPWYKNFVRGKYA